VKPSAFLPNPKTADTSVFRHGKEPSIRLWQIAADNVAGERTVHAAAICKTGKIRSIQLDVAAEEPPPRHANILNWPKMKKDPVLWKAQCKELAALIASDAELLREPKTA